MLGVTALGSKLLSSGFSIRGAYREKWPDQSIYRVLVLRKTWDMEQTAKVAKQLGCDSIELMAPTFFPVLQK